VYSVHRFIIIIIIIYSVFLFMFFPLHLALSNVSSQTLSLFKTCCSACLYFALFLLQCS